MSATANENPIHQSLQAPEIPGARPQKFPAAGAAPYVPIRQFRTACHGIAPPVTIRSAVLVFFAPPHPTASPVSSQAPSSAVPTARAQSMLPAQQPQSSIPLKQSLVALPAQVLRASPARTAPLVTIRQVIPVFATPSVEKEDIPSVRNEDIATVGASSLPAQVKEATSTRAKEVQECEQLKICYL